MYIDWDTVWTNSISGIITGLVVGGILGLVGFYYWKRQNDYSKKQEVYFLVINSLSIFNSNISLLYSDGYEKEDLYLIKSISEDTINLLHYTSNFTYYFGVDYYQPVIDIIEIYRKIRNKEDIKMNQSELDNYLLQKKLIITQAKNKI